MTSEELNELRRAIQADPQNESLIQRLRQALNRTHGDRPTCQRCLLSVHMVRGRVMTKHYYNWTESARGESARQLGYKDALHLVGWRCRICNIVTLATVQRRDQTLDWVNGDLIDPDALE